MTPARHFVQSLRWKPGDGWSAPAVVRVCLALLGLGIVLWMLWVSRSVMQWLAVSAFLAVAINPLVSLLQRRLTFRRAPAIGVVYLLGVAVTVGVASLFVPPLIDAAQGLVDSVPGYIDELSRAGWVQDLDREYDVLDQVRTQVTSVLSNLAGPGVAVDLAGRVVNGILALISIAVLTFLLSLYGPRIRAWVEAQFVGDGRERTVRMLDGMYKVIAGYVVGTGLVALVAASTASIFMWIAGIPYIPVLALWVFFLTFIPLIGATLGGVPYIAVGFFQSWQVGVAAVIFLVVYQQLENNLVQPMIQKRTVNLSPLWIIIAVLMGTQAFGILGALVAIPVAGILQVVAQEWVAGRQGAAPVVDPPRQLDEEPPAAEPA